jgi:hypothetical protein
MRGIGALVFGCLAAAVASTGLAEGRKATGDGWVRYHNERFGFSLDDPASVFRLERTSAAGDGRVFVAGPGEARLLVGALANRDQHSAKSYQAHLALNAYPGYTISYRPLGDTWLVSGEGNGKLFYEKAMFSCGGKLITSFAMIYPAAKRATFDPIVARVANSFVAGTRQCQQAAGPIGDEPGRESRGPRQKTNPSPGHPRSRTADRLARQRGSDVLVIRRRTSPPYDYKVVRGYATR